MTEVTPSTPTPETFLPILLRAPNAVRKELLFTWSVLAEIGANPPLYYAALDAYPLVTEGAADLSAERPTERDLTLNEARDLAMARLLARVRIETDEVVHGSNSSKVFGEAVVALKKDINQRSSVYELLNYAVKALAIKRNVAARAFPETQTVFCVEAVGDEKTMRKETPVKEASTDGEASKPFTLAEMRHLMAYAGCATALVGEDGKDGTEDCGEPTKLYLRNQWLDSDTLERLLASFAAHEAGRFRVTRIRRFPLGAFRPEFRPAYGPTSFHQALCFEGIRSWIKRLDDMDLWPRVKAGVKRTFDYGAD